MKISRLKDHALVKEASKVVQSYIRKCDPHNPELDPVATKQERYAIEIFMSLSNVLTCIDQLYFTIDLLAGFRKNEAPKKMNRYDYILFAVENYYLRITSVDDRCLRLANIVFQLGLPERECKKSTIIKNDHVKRTPVAKALNNLAKFTEDFRCHRNTVAHEATFSEERLNKIGQFYYLLDEDPEIREYYFGMKRRTDTFVADKKEEFRKNVIEQENFVEQFFDAVLVIFESRLKIIPD